MFWIVVGRLNGEFEFVSLADRFVDGYVDRYPERIIFQAELVMS